MTNSSNTLRKAAIVVAHLDEAIAKQLLACLGEVEAEQVMQVAQNLDQVSQSEIDEAMESFAQLAPTSISKSTQPATKSIDKSNGVELDPSLAELLERTVYEDDFQDTSQTLAMTGKYQKPAPEGPFNFLEQTDTEMLIAALEGEHPQMVAIVLSCLESDRAAELILKLPRTMQGEILKRLSDLEPGDPDSIAALAEELKGWIEQQQREKTKRERGLSAVQNILNSVSQKDHAKLVVEIQQNDETFADQLGLIPKTPTEIVKGEELTPSVKAQRIKLEQSKVVTSPALERMQNAKATLMRSPTIQKALSTPTQFGEARIVQARIQKSIPKPQASPLIPFEKLAYLDNSIWQQLLSVLEPEILTLALTTAPPELIACVTNCLPTVQAKSLKKAIRNPGTVRLTDIDAAKLEIRRVASTFIETPIENSSSQIAATQASKLQLLRTV